MIRLYDSRLSGNAWKVRLLLRFLEIPFERVSLDLAAGEAKSESFAPKTPFARVPVLELDDGRTIFESAAILFHLAEGTRFLPEDPVTRAEALGWMFFEQADLLKPIAFPRFFRLRGIEAEKVAAIAEFHAVGNPALDRLERALEGREWIVGDAISVADLALYGYVAMAPEAGYDLTGRPSTKAWLARIEALPGWEPLVPEAAE